MGLIHYWAMSKSNPQLEIENEKNMTLQRNVQKTTDRYGNINSALFFNKSFAILPPGVYFDFLSDGSFTIMFWLKINFLSSKPQTIIEFGNGELLDTFRIVINVKKKEISNCISYYQYCLILNFFDLTDQWTHFTFVRNKIYVNGENQDITQTVYNGQNSPTGFLRGSNFIGYSNLNTEYLVAGFDELKIFNRELKYSEIISEKNKNKYPMSWKLIIYTSTSENSGSNSKQIDFQLIGSLSKSEIIELDYRQNKIDLFEKGSVDEFQIFTELIGDPMFVELSRRNHLRLEWRLSGVIFLK